MAYGTQGRVSATSRRMTHSARGMHPHDGLVADDDDN